MRVAIDHVTIGGPDLRNLVRQFERAGFSPKYGGIHSNGITHMSLVGFPDGSYIELISTVAPNSPSPVWGRHIENDGGPCAWAIGVDDIAGEVLRARALDIPASGPDDYTRRRPDGVLVEWQLGFLGSGEPGSTLPFMIKDLTPRSYRIENVATTEGEETGLKGITRVIVGTSESGGLVSDFRKLYGWGEPIVTQWRRGDTKAEAFPDGPVVVASPSGPGWLRERLARFGPSPCAFLIETRDMDRTARKMLLSSPEPWVTGDGNEVRWSKGLLDANILLGFTDGSDRKTN